MFFDTLFLQCVSKILDNSFDSKILGLSRFFDTATAASKCNLNKCPPSNSNHLSIVTANLSTRFLHKVTYEQQPRCQQQP